MDLISDYLKHDGLTVQSIKNSVDDYSIYSHYIGEEWELGRAYSSPLRKEDTNPSFSLFEVRDSILFKDHGIGLKGDVIKFLQYYFSSDKNPIPIQDVLNQINLDFDLGLEGTPKTFQPKAKIVKNYITRERPKINISSKPYSIEFLSYFNRYGITASTLRKFNVYDVSVVFYNYSYGTKVFYPKTLCIAYRIGKYYKIYMPLLSKLEKFRTDLPRNYVEGFIQLNGRSKFCLLTKSMKEVLFFYEHFKINVVAGKSENTMIPDFLMKKLFNDYEHVLIWLDRDEGGKRATEEYLKKYPKLISVNYSGNVLDKDPTDRYFTLKSQNRQKEAIEEIKIILQKFL